MLRCFVPFGLSALDPVLKHWDVLHAFLPRFEVARFEESNEHKNVEDPNCLVGLQTSLGSVGDTLRKTLSWLSGHGTRVLKLVGPQSRSLQLLIKPNQKRCRRHLSNS